MPLSQEIEPIQLKSRRTNGPQDASGKFAPTKPYQPISVNIFDMKGTSLVFENKHPHKITMDTSEIKLVQTKTKRATDADSINKNGALSRILESRQGQVVRGRGMRTPGKDFSTAKKPMHEIRSVQYEDAMDKSQVSKTIMASEKSNI